MSSGSSASTEIIESRDQMNSSNGNSCGPTVLETKLTLRDKSTTLKLSSKISVSKSEDLFVATKTNDSFIPLFKKFCEKLCSKSKLN